MGQLDGRVAIVTGAAVIAAIVLVEKPAPAGPLPGRLTGIGLMAAGAAAMIANV